MPNTFFENGSKSGVGVVVGRFQVHKLHEGHTAILDKAAMHKKMLVLVGVHPFLVTPTDPLDFPTREKMIREKYPQAMIAPIPDQRSDEVWSKNLDGLIRSYCPLDSVTLYCGRDGFANYYHGKFPIKEMDEVAIKSGTDIRAEISQEVKNSEDFRAGVVYGAYNKWSVIAPVVDIIAIKKADPDNNRCGPRAWDAEDYVLLGRKPNETVWRFPGGFIDPEDKDAQEAAERELQEETGLTIQTIDCLGAYFVDDWRCTEKYKMISILFAGKTWGAPQAGDDLCETRWVRLMDLKDYKLTNTHDKMLEEIDWY